MIQTHGATNQVQDLALADDADYDAVVNRLSRTITAGGTTTETDAHDPLSSHLLSVDDGSTTRSS